LKYSGEAVVFITGNNRSLIILFFYTRRFFLSGEANPELSFSYLFLIHLSSGIHF